ncbi:hypothetical protein CVT24_003616 [Panaeolus cyanescens]|uniref:N-acetyltransferase domain-containing protein n=1 Tax=Panaeolus cyanescens TaxID=181874 RepID=A0A409Y7M7_9AGAR|nr:hypothetical protein CVT24_003616 [Panaeolus cyanescens]
MAHRYAPLPNPGRDTLAQHDREAEMQAAFDFSDDEDDDNNNSETRPLNPNPLSASSTASHTPGTYNFESLDYDYPPPGSPPPLTSAALPNSIGNSNGYIPDFQGAQQHAPRRSWLQSILPASLLSKFNNQRRGPVGGGTDNDGVFANVTAKPTIPVRIQDGDETYIVPEDSRQEAPPSYASAQADAVPPYWETTIHAPFSPDSIGEMVIDSLPTGTLFSFCWNLLVSVSFQFVGFLLTYLLHTSHAARLGSRAGLGITLIQYGFALRAHGDSTDSAGDNGWGDWNSNPNDPRPTGYTTTTAANITWSTPVANLTEEQATILVANATSEWLSFFMMTIGWFILLTSVLGFWRVKRWERGVLASRAGPDNSSNTPHPRQGSAIVSNLESNFGLRGMSRIELLRQGFGFRNSQTRRNNEDDVATSAAIRAEEGEAQNAQETDPMIPLDPSNPQHRQAIISMQNEIRLQRDLREAATLKLRPYKDIKGWTRYSTISLGAMPVKIRPAKVEDEAQLSYICLVTADAGKSAENLHDFAELPGIMYAVPYVHLPTSWGFVLEDEDTGELLGYILGSTDTREFERHMKESWLPSFLDKYPQEVATKPADKHYTALIRNMHVASESNIQFSKAHMHINILDKCQRQGWGRKLVATAVNELKNRGFDRVWLGLDGRNMDARKFYKRIGFKELEGENQMGLIFDEFDNILIK